jgi:peptide/nickel transport system ATP-binding protein
MSLLEVKNLKTYFHIKAGVVKAVDGVSFTLDEGKAIGLVGESGCGKTTTALSIMKLLPPEGRIEGGEILFDGVNLVNESDEEIRKKRWKDISLIFQGAMNAFNPVIRVGDQIIEAIRTHEDVSYEEARKRAGELFELVEIKKDLIDRYPHEFSGGMKQRAMIAMALACNPKLVIGDEPTTALDVMIQAQILDLLERLRKEMKMSMILITHDLSVMAETCDYVAVMYAGKIMEIGKVEKVLENPLHPYTDKLIKAFPDIHGEKVMVESIPGVPPNLIDPPSGCRFHDRCHCAMEICKIKEPEIIQIEDDHKVACHLRGNCQ